MVQLVCLNCCKFREEFGMNKVVGLNSVGVGKDYGVAKVE